LNMPPNMTVSCLAEETSRQAALFRPVNNIVLLCRRARRK